jgi:hypothetical protein
MWGVYIGQTGHSVETRVKQYHQHIRLCHPDKAAVAEHSIILGRHIQLQDTSIAGKTLRCMDQGIWKAIEIELHPNNMKKEDGFSLRKSCPEGMKVGSC